MGDVNDYMRIAAELVRNAPSPDRYVGVVEMLARADAQVAAGKLLAANAYLKRTIYGRRTRELLPTL